MLEQTKNIMVSLYVCDIPSNAEKKEVEELFKDFQGFIECRLVRDKNRDKIAFVDFEKDFQAQLAIERVNGFRFTGSKRGLSVRISEHGRTSLRKRNGIQRKQKIDTQSLPSSMNHGHDSRREEVRLDHGNPSEAVYDPYRAEKPAPAKMLGQDSQNDISLKDFIATTGLTNFMQALGDIPASIREEALPPHMGISRNPPVSISQPPPFPDDSRYPAGIYPEAQIESRPPILLPPSMTTKPGEPVVPAPGGSGFNSFVISSLGRFYNLFQCLVQIPKNATNTVYVEGIPLDTSEREVAHIFRPFPGFLSVRLIPRDTKTGGRVLFCFADFENSLQTTLVINTLQGYRFDKEDIFGLQFSYATTNHKLSNSMQSLTFSHSSIELPLI